MSENGIRNSELASAAIGALAAAFTSPEFLQPAPATLPSIEALR
jgi:hypothetical protein